MKNIKVQSIQIFLVLFMCSCMYKQEQKAEVKETDSVESTIASASISTAYDYPFIDIPSPFYLDSMRVYDTLSRAQYEAVYLQSDGAKMKIFNQKMRKAVIDQINYEQEFVEPYNGDSPMDVIYSYELKPTEIYVSKNIISISHVIDSYAEGGNHHNYTWYSFNYDLSTNKPIGFDDVFSLKNKADSTAFIAFAEQYVLNDGCKDWGWPYNDLDFSLTDNGIYINPNLSWACVSTRSLLPVDAKNKFIKKR